MSVTEQLSAWIPGVQGKYINEDAAYGAQCWDLAANWSRYLGLPKISTNGPGGRWPGWAGNMVDAFPQSPAIAAAYELHGPGEVAKAGDIAVWGDSYWYYPKTHVAVVVRDGGLLTCMSQNSTPSRAGNPYPEWTTGPTTLQALPKTGLIGYIRPRTGLSAMGDIITQEDELSEEAAERIIREVGIIIAQHSKPITETIVGTGKEIKDLVIDQAVRVNQHTTAKTEAVGRVTQQLILDSKTPAEIAALVPAAVAAEVVKLLTERLAK